MKRLIVLCAAAALTLVACGNSSPGSCVTVPQTIPKHSLILSGANVTRRVGTIVYVVLVEPDKYVSGPGFPWLTPTSSDRAVVTPVRLCKRTGASSLPVIVGGFRASHAGTATLIARLAPRWRSINTGLRRYTSSVTVLP